MEPYVYDFLTLHERAVGRSENPGVPVLFGVHKLLPLIDIELTDLSKSMGEMDGTPGNDGPVSSRSLTQALVKLRARE